MLSTGFNVRYAGDRHPTGLQELFAFWREHAELMLIDWCAIFRFSFSSLFLLFQLERHQNPHSLDNMHSSLLTSAWPGFVSQSMLWTFFRLRYFKQLSFLPGEHLWGVWRISGRGSLTVKVSWQRVTHRKDKLAVHHSQTPFVHIWHESIALEGPSRCPHNTAVKRTTKIINKIFYLMLITTKKQPHALCTDRSPLPFFPFGQCLLRIQKLRSDTPSVSISRARWSGFKAKGSGYHNWVGWLPLEELSARRK